MPCLSGCLLLTYVLPFVMCVSLNTEGKLFRPTLVIATGRACRGPSARSSGAAAAAAAGGGGGGSSYGVGGGDDAWLTDAVAKDQETIACAALSPPAHPLL
jgi:geranylgeranyl pyrophosphate synthase